MSKMDLEGKLESLREYVCFLRRLYEEVRSCVEKRGRKGRLPAALREATRRRCLLQWLWFVVINQSDSQCDCQH